MKVPPSAALRYWFRLGWLSFGGPAGQIAMMHTDLVDERRWVSNKRFVHALNFTMALPGPEAQQLAIYIGWLLHGRWGGIAAGTLFVLPSLLLMMLAGWAYLAYGDLPVVDAMLWGVKPVVVAIIIAAAWRIARRVIRRGWMLALAGGAFAGMASGILPFPAIIALSALIGAWVARRWPAGLAVDPEGYGTLDADDRTGGYVIDDDTPPPARARPSLPGFLRMLGIGLGVWAVMMGLVLWLGGMDSLYATQAWFFTKVALVTFGGAYAVLPYVFDTVVNQFGWLTPAQMIDGLALGESTPGPLIMVVAFVGYLAAAGQGSVAGMLGALLVTCFTFLPSYLFILLGAPLVEAARGSVRLTGPLSGIGAAVVGLILNLGLFFALAVFWPGNGTAFDWPAAALTAIVLVGLLSGRIGVITAVALGAMLGAGAKLYLM